MHTCIPWHGLKRSWQSCPGRVNAGNKNALSMHHPRRRKVTTSMVGLKKQANKQNGRLRKNLTQNGEPQIYSWECRRRLAYFQPDSPLPSPPPPPPPPIPPDLSCALDFQGYPLGKEWANPRPSPQDPRLASNTQLFHLWQNLNRSGKRIRDWNPRWRSGMRHRDRVSGRQLCCVGSSPSVSSVNHAPCPASVGEWSDLDCTLCHLKFTDNKRLWRWMLYHTLTSLPHDALPIAAPTSVTFHRVG